MLKEQKYKRIPKDKTPLNSLREKRIPKDKTPLNRLWECLTSKLCAKCAKIQKNPEEQNNKHIRWNGEEERWEVTN